MLFLLAKRAQKWKDQRGFSRTGATSGALTIDFPLSTVDFPLSTFAITVLGCAVVTMADAELMQSVVQQLEFYFSDANLTKDRFLRQRLEESEHEGAPGPRLLLTVNCIGVLIY